MSKFLMTHYNLLKILTKPLDKVECIHRLTITDVDEETVMLQKIINKLNDLRPRQLLILALAAGFLMFLTIIVAMNFVTKKEVAVMPPVEEKAAPPPIEKKAVVVAKVNIPPRTRIQENMLQIKDVPVDMVPEGAITSFDEVKNVQVRASIFSGDILTIQKVFNDKANEGFTGDIPADCRAISINVTEVTGVAGFAKPGDKVDLLLVEKDKYSATTNIILQNVPLLSVNQDADGSNLLDENGIVKSSAISNPTIATFALPPQDIMKLIAAVNLGEIYMMLRPAHPQSNYVDEMQYTLESVNKPRPDPTPVIPANPTPDMPLPQIPGITFEEPAPKFDIIAGDQIVQSSEAAPSATAGGQSALPAIPSRSSQPAPNVPKTTLSNIIPPTNN